MQDAGIPEAPDCLCRVDHGIRSGLAVKGEGTLAAGIHHDDGQSGVGFRGHLQAGHIHAVFFQRFPEQFAVQVVPDAADEG